MCLGSASEFTKLDSETVSVAVLDVDQLPAGRAGDVVGIVAAALPLMKAIRELPTDEHGHVFGVHDRRKAFTRALEDAGIEGNVRFHDFRHTAYTRLKEALLDRLDATITLGDVQKIFGHRVPGMDRVYDHRTVERLRKVMELLPLVRAVSDLLGEYAGRAPVQHHCLLVN